jgi:hypothetical protein
MTDFLAFFNLGLGHILDLSGIDHLLFIASILLVYSLIDWRIIIRLMTAFTLGHAISMAIAFLGITPVSRALIEFLIPLTILVTSIYHLIAGKGSGLTQYIMIAFFGLIHGAAYSGEFMSMMGSAPEILLPLLGFNLGVEFGQLVFGAALLLTLHLLFNAIKSWKRAVTILIFGLITVFSLFLAIQTWPW